MEQSRQGKREQKASDRIAMEQLSSALLSREWSSLELGEAEQTILASGWEEEQKKEVLRIVREKRANSGQTAAAGPQARAPLQDWIYLASYLTEPIWQLILAGKQVQGLSALCQHLRRMGLRHPSEGTQAVVAALLLHQSSEDSLRNSLPFFQTVKVQMKAQLGGQPIPAGEEYVLTLPCDVQAAPESVRLAAAATGPIAPAQLEVLELQLANIIT